MLSEDTFCSQCRNTRTLFIGLLFARWKKSLERGGKRCWCIPIMKSVNNEHSCEQKKKDIMSGKQYLNLICTKK